MKYVVGDSLGYFYSYPPGQNGPRFADDIFTCIFVNEKVLYFDQNFTEVCT